MTLIVPNVAEVLALVWFLQAEDLFLRLYSNDYTPVEGATLASFTEVDGGGYAAKTLDKDNWTISSGAPSFGLYSRQEFIFSGTTTLTNVYGYYVSDAADIVRWAERFALTPVAPIAGSKIRITPRFEAS